MTNLEMFCHASLKANYTVKNDPRSPVTGEEKKAEYWKVVLSFQSFVELKMTSDSIF